MCGISIALKLYYMTITKLKNRSHNSILVVIGALVLSFVTIDIAISQVRNPSTRASQAKIQKARIEIDKLGYQPASLSLKRGQRAEIVFLRKTDQTCATEVVFADYGIRRDLPLNQEIVVRFTPTKAGEFAFTCGMNMHRGKLIVR
jgi:plastocyanin domain-containing protein